MQTLSSDLAQSLSSITQVADSYSQSAVNLHEHQEVIVNAIDTLKAGSQKISKLSDFVMQVSSKTNLLGLNAAIEAARAGEAGRGFSVVAQEVRKLADEAKGSSQEIQEMIASITNQIENISSQVQETMNISQDQAASAEEVAALIQDVKEVAVRLKAQAH
ncbi:methyl-accepting chemotaxis protein [Cytobacillus sp. FJAT-54145]|uniref:Methyl-accepting chemotaxis protein n=1 Tax=Cytobacillus spartinae TaxID=3299023 RepID=A0ABW6KBK1_9BACI